MPPLGRITRALPLPPDGLRRLALRHPQRYPVLLDSTAHGARATASILAAFPQAALWRTGDGVLHSQGAAAAVGRGGARPATFLDALDACWLRERLPTATGASELEDIGTGNAPCFRGGWIVYLGYEMAQEAEPALHLSWRAAPPDASRIDAFALRCPAALVRDEPAGRVRLVLEPGASSEIEARVLEDVAALQEDAAAGEDQAGTRWRVTEEDPALFLDRVRRAQEHIRAGDIYQANLSRAWCARFEAPATTASLCAPLYVRLCNANPGPFAALARFRELTLLSSSPERLLRIAGERVETRPIAGTHPRRADQREDDRQAAALKAHPKERAEHVMLIDLARNDLGRVCRPGTVEVDEYMVIESYAHVHHIVSNVRGRLREGVTPVACLRAVFPGGTITGCPKFRCMQIIAELEDEPRGPYTGSLGYINRDGSADFNILIRTMSLGRGTLLLRAGAGIVADSDPGRELEETRAKARGLLATLNA